MTLIIEKGTLKRGCLDKEVCVITGAGRGIGLETARSMAWLGAKVIIAEIDQGTGERAAASINEEFGDGAAVLVRTDVADESSVNALADVALARFGRVDIVVNNATVFRMGAVTEVPVSGWDLAYGVNLRGPVLLARAFLPGMIKRDHGTFVCISSSGAAPFMGAYEVFKTAQVELARVIDSEMEGKNVNVFTIGPGLVHTPGSDEGIRILAPLYNKTEEEFFAMSKEVQLTAEEAGAGFAASVALAERFRGQEISSFAALSAIGISVAPPAETSADLGEDRWKRLEALTLDAFTSLDGQYKGWKEMIVFKRQWILRDFKNGAGMSVEQWLEALKGMHEAAKSRDATTLSAITPPLSKLSAYYSHMEKLLDDYEKDPQKLATGKAAIEGWIRTIEELRSIWDGGPGSR